MHIGTAYLPYLSEFSILALPIRIERGNFKNKQTTTKLFEQ